MKHLTREELEGYGGRTMAAAGVLAVDRHLAECVECRSELRRLVAAPTLPALVLEMEEPVHLTYEEMSGYVDAKLDESNRVRMEQHMHLCRSCTQEVRELKAFDARLAADFQTASANSTATAGPNWLKRLRNSVSEFWATPQRVGFASAGMAMMVLAIVSLVKVQAGGGGDLDHSRIAAHLTMLSSAAHPHLFYGGFLILAGGLLALLLGLFKR